MMSIPELQHVHIGEGGGPILAANLGLCKPIFVWQAKTW